MIKRAKLLKYISDPEMPAALKSAREPNKTGSGARCLTGEKKQ
jgi:hypothetical protein